MPSAVKTKSYKDPAYDTIERKLEEKYGLPIGGMSAIRTRGEKSNADQVSPVGAATVYQIMPATARRFQAKYGINAFEGPEQAAEVAALHLRDDLRRTGSWEGAVRGYIGGPDPRQHGKVTAAYVARVTGAPRSSPAGPSDPGAYEVAYTAPAPMSLDTILNSRPADFREAGRPQGRLPKDPNTTAKAIKAQGIKDVTGGAGLLTQTFSGEADIASVTAPQAQDQIEQAEQDSLGFVDRLAAAARNTLTYQIATAIDGQRPQEEADFREFYVKNRIKIEEFAQDDRELDWLRTATSRADLVQIEGRISAKRGNDKILNSGGSLSGLLTQLGADILDPVSLLAGAGAAKGFQVAKVGATVLKASGRPVLAAVSLAAESAAANVGITAGLDATGTYTTGSDYLLSGLAGAGAGLVLAPLALRGIKDTSALQAVEKIEAAVTAKRGEFEAAARVKLGPDVAEDVVVTEARRTESDEFYRGMVGLLDEVPDDLRLLAPKLAEGEEPLDGIGEGFLTKDPKVREAVIAKYRFNDTIADDAERAIVSEYTARAERIATANPIEGNAGSPLLAKAGLESTGARLRNSTSPVLRAFALVATESTTGAGGRRYTAALGHAVRERLYLNQISRHEDLFHLFREEQGVGLAKAFYSGQVRKDFDSRVFAEIEGRGGKGGSSTDTSPSVVQAADAHERGYQLIADDQRGTGTVGSARLAPDSRGYVPHQLSARLVAALNPAQRTKVIDLLTKQIVSEEDFGAKFAKKLAKTIIGRADDKRFGSYDVPFNLRSTEGADIVREALEASGVSADEVTNEVAKFARGGATHTKKRLKLDLSADLGNGVKLQDLYNTDVVSLYRGQARRVAGEASLARYGILGKHGLKQLRLAAEKTGASVDEITAFDQVSAELLNTPFGEHNHLYLDNARLATSVARLGGMGITQLSEYGNGLAAVGAQGTLSAVSSFGRIAKEVRGLSRGAPSENALLKSLDEVGGYIGLDDYQNSRLFNSPDNDVQMYGAETIGLFTRSLRGAQHVQAGISGWRMITATQTRGFAEENLKRTLKFVRSGGDDKALNDMGITGDLRDKLKANLDKMAEFDSRGRLKSFDIRAGDLSNYEINALRGAIERGSSQIIQRTYIGETGKWAHDGYLKILTQFRTFSLVSVEKQWGRNVKNYGALKSGMYLMGALSVAGPIHMARVHSKMLGMSDSDKKDYADKHLSAVAIGRAALNYSSSAGFLGDILDVGASGYSSVTGDDAGLADFSGAGGKQGGNFFGGAVAPSLGLGNDIAQGLGNLHSETGRKKLFKALPGSNLPFVIPLFNLATSE